MVRARIFLGTLVVGLLAMAGSANAAYTLTGPAAGSSTTTNRVTTTWTGACDAGFTCPATSFYVVYSQKPDVDGTGRLVETAATEFNDPYESAWPRDPSAGTVLSPMLDPSTWYVQLQWNQCDADHDCTDRQTAPSRFTLAHSVLRPTVRVTARYTHLRQVDYRAEFSGNARRYTVQGIVSTQVRRNGRFVWAPLARTAKTVYGQYGTSRAHFTWKAGRTRRGTKLRVQAVVTTPGMKPRVVTTFTTSP